MAVVTGSISMIKVCRSKHESGPKWDVGNWVRQQQILPRFISYDKWAFFTNSI